MKPLSTIKKASLKVISLIGSVCAYGMSYADGIIPISNTDQTTAGTDFSTTAMNIVQKDILPFVELGGAAVILFVALNGLWKGYKDYQREKDMDPLKTAVVSAVILIVVGGAILYLIDTLRSYRF